MNNIDLFAFDFVDRKEERKMVADFLSSKNNPNQVLCIKGDRGVGKTYFIENVFGKNEEWCLIHINPVEGENDTGYIVNFIQKLQEKSKFSFISYIKLNYSSVISSGKTIVKGILNIAQISDFGIADIIADCAQGFIDEKQGRHTLDNVIAEYIKSILREQIKIVIAFDNFTKCSLTLTETIQTTILKNLNNENIKFVISTTTEDLNKSQLHRNFLAEKIPNIPLNINPFVSNSYFIEILSRCYETDDSEVKECLQKLFQCSEGYPQRFKEILINLHSNNGINYGGDAKATFSSEKFKEILLEGMTNLDYKSLPYEQKIILSILSIWRIPVPIRDFTNYLSYLLDSPESGLIFTTIENLNQAIPNLINIEVLKIENYCQEACLKFQHDSISETVNLLSSNIVENHYLALSSYDFLEKKIITTHKNEYWNSNLSYLQSLLSYLGNRSDWKEINYEYAVSLHEKGHYYEALQIFKRFDNELFSISPTWQLAIAKNLIECGEFENCELLLLTIKNKSLNSLSVFEQIQLYSLLARAECHLFNYDQSFLAIDEAIQLAKKNQQDDFELLAQKQNIYFMAPGKFKQAKALFNSLHSLKLDHVSMIDVYISSMDFREGNDSLKLLNKGYELAQKYNENGLETSKIMHNQGFEHIRCNNLKDAFNLTEDARIMFEKTSFHYQGYSYNNLAVIEMINGNWQEAIENLKNAYYWNKSKYLTNVINTNFYICYSELNDINANKYRRDLEKLINQNKGLDDRIYKKVLINFAIMALKKGDKEAARKHLKEYEPHTHNDIPSGQHRFARLYNHLFDEQLPLPETLEETDYYYKKIDFEPWLVTITYG